MRVLLGFPTPKTSIDKYCIRVHGGTKVADMNTHKGLTAAISEVLIAEKATTDFTYDALVDLTGMSRSTLVRYFKGQRSMTLAELDTICGVLGLDFFDVVTRAQARMKSSSPAEGAQG